MYTVTILSYDYNTGFCEDQNIYLANQNTKIIT